jgi:hypothetical protein
MSHLLFPMQHRTGMCREDIYYSVLCLEEEEPRERTKKNSVQRKPQEMPHGPTMHSENPLHSEVLSLPYIAWKRGVTGTINASH